MSNDRKTVSTTIDPESSLAERWDDWESQFDQPAVAARQAIKAGIGDEDPAASAARGVHAGLVVLLVLLLGTLRAVYDWRTMGVVFALALGAFAVVYAAPGVARKLHGER